MLSSFVFEIGEDSTPWTAIAVVFVIIVCIRYFLRKR